MQQLNQPSVRGLTLLPLLFLYSNSEWTVVQKKQKPKLPICVRGAKTMDSSQAPATPGVRSVPRKPVLAAYVGRLHQDTTEEALTEYLKEEGMKGVTCRKLKSKDGKVYRASAFYVTCCTESCELFYNEQCCPDGVELRDWVYKN